MRDGIRISIITAAVLAVCLGVVGLGVAGVAADEDIKTDEYEVDPVAALLEHEHGEGTGLETTEQGHQATAASNNVELHQTFRALPEREGFYEMEHEYSLPGNLQRLEVRLPSDTHNENPQLDGFVHEEGDTYRWDGQTQSPSITYVVNGDRTLERDDPIAAPGRFIFTDQEDWSLVSRPAVSHSWGWTGDRVGFDRTASVDGPGQASDIIAFLGEHDEHTHEAHGQTFRLIEPDAASLSESPEAIFDSLAMASDYLRVGDRDEEVFMIAAPTEGITWGVRGLQTGPADLWVRDSESLSSPDNVWLHEYVHTRQDYATADDLEWFTEATATYYAAYLTLRQERISFQQFSDRLAVGTQQRFSDVRLDTPTTWRANNGNYQVGALVTGAIDRELREATDKTGSFQSVFASMNAYQGQISAAQFNQFVAGAGGDQVRDSAVQFTETTTRPELWTQEQHAAAFGDRPAIFTFEFGTATVDGPDRTETLSGTPLVLAPNESLSIDITVRNVGDTAGDYDAAVLLNDDEIDRLTGELDPSESSTHTVSASFEEIGENTLSVEGTSTLISVREGAAASPGDDGIPGFTVATAMVGALLSIGLLARRTS